MHSQHPATRCCYIFMRCQDLDLGDSSTYFSMAVGVFKPLICIQPCIYICSIFLLTISVSIGCTTCQTAYSKHMYQSSHLSHVQQPTKPADREHITFTPITHVPGCLKCGRSCKGHPLPYSNNCTLALAKEHEDESRDTPACWVEGLLVTLLPGSFPMVDQAPPALSEQSLRPLTRAAHSAPVPPVATTTTITTGGSTEHSLAILSTRVGQEDKWLAQDRQWIDKLSHQFSDTTMQTAPISKVLDCLLENHTPMAVMTGATMVSVVSSVSGTASSGQVAVTHIRALPWVRPIPQPAVFTLTGRQSHSVMQVSHNPVKTYRIRHFPSGIRHTAAP